MPLHAVELTLDETGDAWVRGCWDELARAGLPSQAHHRGATNAPHLTLATAPAITAPQAAGAGAAFAPLLPVELPVTGLVVLGSRRLALALLVAPPVALTVAVDSQRDLIGDPYPSWVPHVTLARGLDAEQAGRAIGLLTGAGAWPVLAGSAVRHWDPDERVVRQLA